MKNGARRQLLTWAALEGTDLGYLFALLAESEILPWSLFQVDTGGNHKWPCPLGAHRDMESLTWAKEGHLGNFQ